MCSCTHGRGRKMSEQDKNITISDVAEALGVSKTTVSRAISGKGRIGEATRQRILEYIEEHDYKPNVIAKGLAQSRTYNICVVMPGNYSLVDLPFFQEIIMGIQEVAGMSEYDILLCTCQENDVAALERIVSNRKVDGVILLRTYVKDAQIEFLQSKKLPFVTVGSTDYEHVVQIDHDHESACRELTSIMLMRKMKRIALLGGNDAFVVTKSRYKGFTEAFTSFGREPENELIYMNLESRMQIEKAVEELIEKLAKLRQDELHVPQDVRIASFYNSSVLENSTPSITSLSFDVRELGMVSCKELLQMIGDESVPEKTLLTYEVVLKESTK